MEKPPFQFSLKALFFVLTIVGALAAAWVHLPHFVLLLWAIAAVGVLYILVRSKA